MSFVINGRFQSLDWVERLSDRKRILSAAKSLLFQSLDWVERLSDFDPPKQQEQIEHVSIPRLG